MNIVFLRYLDPFPELCFFVYIFRTLCTYGNVGRDLGKVINLAVFHVATCPTVQDCCLN